MELQQILRKGFDDFRDFVNPLIAQRARLSGEPVEMVHTDEGRLQYANGRMVEDFHGTQAFGHRNQHITEALITFLQSDSPSWYPSRVNPYAGSLARRLCKRSGYSNAYFANSGSEAVESGIKLARAVTKRPEVLGLKKAYHGCTMGSCGLMADSIYRELFKPHLPGLSSLPINDIPALEAALSSGEVAGVVVEPIQLEGGVRMLSDAYIQALCELTERHGTLLIADEVQTGLGRTGQFLASETWPRRPDAALLGKHLGGGLMPISAMLTRKDLYERAYGENFETSEAHNCTFSGNAAACVAAIAAQELLTDECITRVREYGQAFRERLHTSLSELPLFKEVRGKGLIAGIELHPAEHPWLSFEHFGFSDLSDKPTTGLLLCHRLYKRGFFCFVCGHDWGVIRLQPRFNISLETLDGFVDVVHEELEKLCDLI